MYRYCAFSKNYILEDGEAYRGYGIVCTLGEGERARQIACVEDISCDGDAVAALAARCTAGNLSPMHLLDVVEDWLLTQEFPEPTSADI